MPPFLSEWSYLPCCIYNKDLWSTLLVDVMVLCAFVVNDGVGHSLPDAHHRSPELWDGSSLQILLADRGSALVASLALIGLGPLNRIE